MLRKIITIAFLATLTASAFAQQERLFSFASDDTTDGPTFNGSLSQITSKDVVVDLKVDVNEDMTGGLITFQSQHRLEARLYDYMVQPCGPNFLHTWKAEGTIYFFHYAAPGFPGILRIEFFGATLTSISPDPSFIIDTMTLQSNEASDPNMNFLPLTILNGLGWNINDVDVSENFAYTFTHLRGSSGDKIAVDTNGDLLDEWVSEGSFSASAN